EALEGGLVLIVAADIAEAGGEPLKGAFVDLGDPGGRHGLPGPGAQCLVLPVRGGHTDDRPAVEHAAGGQVIERREELLVRQVAGGAEEHQGVGPGARPRRQSLRAGGAAHVWTACPPNCWRRAAITFMAGDSSCREANRANSAAEMAGAGTARRTAS